jgi:threonylcarbamoyladenosine tRNA methylthiotransferase MtaB
VLTGVNLGHYKNRIDEPHVINLAHLCRMILEETSLCRLRLSSIEPQTFRNELLDLFRLFPERMCRYAHLPLQSGSSRILQLMQRPYDQRTYLRKLQAIKESVNNVVTGADVIVGFPGETDSDFQETYSVAKSGLLDYLHIFTYSEREGTPASRMNGKVHPSVAKERIAMLSELSHRLRANAYQRQVGTTLSAVVLRESAQGKTMGITDNFLNVEIIGSQAPARSLVSIDIVSATEDFLIGYPAQGRAISEA